MMRRVAALGGLNVVVYVAIVAILLVSILGPFVVPAEAYQSDIQESLLPPSAAHWFGTDEQGRDVFWRVIAGARYSVLSSILVVAGYATIGVIMAVIASVGGRWVDGFIMRATDAGIALPTIIFALAVATVLGPSLRSAIIALIITQWPFTTRLLRGIIRETAQTAFVEGATILGVSRVRLYRHHVLPNSLDVMWVKWTGDVGGTILVLTGLSFIGVGAQPPSPEWGAMVTNAQSYIASAWWATVAPGLAIAVAATAFGLLGEILQVRLNPELRGQLQTVAIVRTPALDEGAVS